MGDLTGEESRRKVIVLDWTGKIKEGKKVNGEWKKSHWYWELGNLVVADVEVIFVQHFKKELENMQKKTYPNF